MRGTIEDVEMPDLNAGEERDQHHAKDPEEKATMTTEARLRLRPEHSAWFDRGRIRAIQFFDALKNRQTA
jgi:hypothetical protein